MLWNSRSPPSGVEICITLGMTVLDERCAGPSLYPIPRAGPASHSASSPILTARTTRPATGSPDSILLTLRGHSLEVYDVTFSADGTRIATGSDRTARIWEVDSGKELLTLVGHTDLVDEVAFSRDGSRIATRVSTAPQNVWDAKTGKELATLAGHSGFVHGVAFSPDGSHLATTSNDLTARIWDLAPPSELFTVPTTNSINDSGILGTVVYSPDGRRIAAGFADGTVKVWGSEVGKGF